MAILSRISVCAVAGLALLALATQGAAALPSSKHQHVLGGDAEYAEYRLPEYPQHAVRIRKQTDEICDAGSAQYTGWIDNGGKHIFFCGLQPLILPFTMHPFLSPY